VIEARDISWHAKFAWNRLAVVFSTNA